VEDDRDVRSVLLPERLEPSSPRCLRVGTLEISKDLDAHRRAPHANLPADGVEAGRDRRLPASSGHARKEQRRDAKHVVLKAQTDLQVSFSVAFFVWVHLSLMRRSFKNTKHILRAAQFLRDLVARLVVTMEHIAGTEMIADMLTKPLGRVLFVRLLSLLDN
jgi:hypothetical protein